MFDNISLDDYDLSYELQRSQFFKDCLDHEIDFQFKNGSVSVYKKLDSGISEEISVDELIYFIHYDVAKHIRAFRSRVSCSVGSENLFRSRFSSIDCIRNAVENMKILLKYGELEEENKYRRSKKQGEEQQHQSPVAPPPTTLKSYYPKKSTKKPVKKVKGGMQQEKEAVEEKEEPLMTEVSTVKIG